MAATVKIVRLTGAAPPSATDLNPSGATGINTRANLSDAHSTADLNNPIPIPTAGFNYSYWVSTRLNCTATPAGTINNVRWFTDGSNNFGTGVTAIAAKASTGADSGYRQATGSVSSGTILNQTNHTGLDEAPVDPFVYTSASPRLLNGTLINPATGQFGDIMVVQLVIASNASPGVTNQEEFSWRYDET